MMTLAQASSYFDRTEVFDAYSGASLFHGQIDPYDDSKRDAMAAYRRVLSVAPGTLIPSHRAIDVFGIRWLVAGEPEIDGLAEPHRVKYVLQMTEGAFRIGTVTDFLDGGGSISPRYAFPSWVKDAKQIEESSDVANLFEIILPLDTAVGPKQVIWKAGAAYLTLSARRLPSDFVGANSVRLDQAEPFEAVIRSRTFSPTEGKFVVGQATYTQALRVRWQSLFDYDAQLAPRFQEGDFTLAFAEETELSTSSRVEFEGELLSVLSVNSIAGGVIAHVRRV